MRRLFVTMLLALAPLALADTDVSGKWTGSMDVKAPTGMSNSTPVVAELKQMGATVTGTANAAGFDPLTIEKGMLEGNQLTFEVRTEEGTYAVKVTVDESQLKGEVVFTPADGNKQTASLTFTRD